MVGNTTQRKIERFIERNEVEPGRRVILGGGGRAETIVGAEGVSEELSIMVLEGGIKVLI